MLVVPVFGELVILLSDSEQHGRIVCHDGADRSLFCVPTRKRMLDELDLVKEENEEPAL